MERPNPLPVRVVAPVLVVLACLPFAIAAARTVSSGWVPISDDAVAAVLTHDVVSTDTPLVGMRSSAGDGRGNHPGPTLFWVLAPLDAASGSAPWSFPVSVALLASLSLVGIAVAAHRVAGLGALVGGLAVATTMAFSLGRQVVVDPWNPHAAVLPFLAALFLTWAVAAGWSWGLPLVTVALGFVAQAHLVYGPFAAVLLLAAVLVVARGPRPWPPVLTSAGVAVVMWALPLFEQLTGDPGNVTRLQEAAGVEGDKAVGDAWALRTVARGVGMVPSFVLPARWTDDLEPSTSPLTAVTAIVVVVAVAALGGAAWRRRDRAAVAAAGTAALALVTGSALLSTLPPYLGLGVPQWRYLFVWPLGAFTWFALAFLVVRMAGDRTRRVVVGAAAALLVVSVVAMPFADSPETGDFPVRDAIRELGPELAAEVEGLGPVRVDAYGPPEIDRYGFFQELRRRGVDVRVRPEDEYLGEEHPGGDDLPTVVVVAGVDAPPPPAGRLLTTWDTIRAEDRARLAEVETRVGERFGDEALARGPGWSPPGADDEELELLREWATARDALDGRSLRVYLVPPAEPAPGRS